MKKFLLSLVISIISLLVLSTICSVVFSIILYNNQIKINPFIIYIISIVMFLLAGMIFGFINKKQGLLGSIVFILVYLIFFLIFDVFTNKESLPKLYFLIIIGKCLAYSVGSIISVNLRKS